MSILHIKPSDGVEEQINLSTIASIDTTTTFKKSLYVSYPIEFQISHPIDELTDTTKALIFTNKPGGTNPSDSAEIMIACVDKVYLRDDGTYDVSWDFEDDPVVAGSKFALRSYTKGHSFNDGRWSMISTNGIDKELLFWSTNDGVLCEERRYIQNNTVKHVNRRLDGYRQGNVVVYGNGFMIQWGVISLNGNNYYDLVFEIEFPTTPVVQATIIGGSTNTMFIVKSDIVTTAGCKLVAVKHQNQYQTGGRVSWVAFSFGA